MVAVYPSLIDIIPHIFYLFHIRAEVRPPLRRKADGGACRACIQRIVGVDLVREPLDQRAVRVLHGRQEMLCKLGIVDSCRLPILEEAADILREPFCHPLLLRVCVLHALVKVVNQLRLRAGLEVLRQPIEVVQVVAQFVGHGRQVVCYFRPDALVRAVVPSSGFRAADVAGGDADAEIMADLPD